jgi:galactose-1-phosphate uridylyltransferase
VYRLIEMGKKVVVAGKNTGVFKEAFEGQKAFKKCMNILLSV